MTERRMKGTLVDTFTERKAFVRANENMLTDDFFYIGRTRSSFKAKLLIAGTPILYFSGLIKLSTGNSNPQCL